MQIFRWLFKLAHEQERENGTSSPYNKETVSDKEAKLKGIILFKNSWFYRRFKSSEGSSKLGCKKLKPFRFLCRKDVAKVCFYNTLNLKRLGSYNSRRRQHWIKSMKMKKEDLARGLGISTTQKVDSSSTTNAAGNKVLPVNDIALSSSSETNIDHHQCSSGTTSPEKKDRFKGDKTKALSRMKELLRWAAAAKSEKGGKFIVRKVLHFRNRGSLKAVADEDQLSFDSPKISFRWDVESCSTISSVHSGISMASSSKNIDQTNNMLSLNPTPIHDINQCTTRRGNWITTDSEFVVLEL